MSIATGVLLFGAAVLGGAINSVAGGGSFVTFPALLFAGIPAVPANATSTIALWPGTVASVLAYRRELRDVRRELLPMGVASLAGGLGGSVLLLRTSDRTFVLLIPWLLLFATVIFSFGGPVAKRLSHGARAPLAPATAAQLLVSVYGGYFGGGAGIMMLAILSVLGMADIHRMNALKALLGALINGVAVVAFVVAGAVAWTPGVVMIAGGITGGYAGAAIARRVDPKHVRGLVLGVAWTMTAYFFVHTYR
ncbi:MAG: sulfite exporter TauE/SafE family protein [Polyangiaceae bacterium]